jgi:hypothetical protein
MTRDPSVVSTEPAVREARGGFEMDSSRPSGIGPIDEHPRIARVAGVVGILVHLAGAIVYLVYPGLIVAFPVPLLYYGAWAIVLVLSIRWLGRHPWRSLVVPIVGVALAYATLLLGGQFLGWRG